MRVRVEVAVFTVRHGTLEVLLGRGPAGTWTLPCADPEDQMSLDGSAARAMEDSAGLRGITAEQLYTFDRGEGGVAVAYLALIDSGRHPLAAGGDVAEVRWFAHDDLHALADGQEAVVAYGLSRLRAKTSYAPVAVNLLPDVFTLGEMQAVYEVLLGRVLDARNFRRDVLRAGVVQE